MCCNTIALQCNKIHTILKELLMARIISNVNAHNNIF